MAHDDEFELAHADFSRYPGTPGMPLERPLPSYSEDDDDIVTVAMRPLEEQLVQPGPEPTWGRDFGRGDLARGNFAPSAGPAAVLPTPGVMQPPPVALPAPPVARAPSVRPPAAPPVAVAQVAVAQVAVAARVPAVSAYARAPSPPAPAARVEAAPSPRPPPSRTEVAPSAMAPSVRPLTSASAPTISVRTRPAVFAQALAQAAAAQP